jgi:hypothetical protein
VVSRTSREATVMNTDQEITLAEAVHNFGQDIVDQARTFGRHHLDDDGNPVWLCSDLDEILETIEFEKRREGQG